MMCPEDKAEILVAGWLSMHGQESIPNGLNQLKAIIADAIEQERDRKLRGGPFVKVPYDTQYNFRMIDLGRVTAMEIVSSGYNSGGQEREVELRYWFEDDLTKYNGFEMSRKRAEEIMALWMDGGRVPAERNET